MRYFSRVTALTASAAIGLAGCSNPFTHSGVNVGTSGTYDQFSKDYQQHSVVAPGMGLDNSPQPSAMQKFGSAVAAVPDKVGSAVKSGATKATSWMAPSSSAAVATTTTSSGGWFSKKPEGSAELHVATARMYEKNGNFPAATDEYEKALKLAPNDSAALLSYGHLLDHQGKLSEATNLYVKAVKANPREAAAYNDLGLCYARRSMINDSLKALSKAVELQPQRELYRNNIATVLVDQHQTDAALTQLRAVESESVANYNIGYLLMQRHQDSVAQGYFQRCATAGSGNESSSRMHGGDFPALTKSADDCGSAGNQRTGGASGCGANAATGLVWSGSGANPVCRWKPLCLGTAARYDCVGKSRGQSQWRNDCADTRHPRQLSNIGSKHGTSLPAACPIGKCHEPDFTVVLIDSTGTVRRASIHNAAW